MTQQMTIRIDDEAAAFVDRASRAGEGSRADVINRALRREMRRRLAAADAAIYVASADPDLESDAYAAWARAQAATLGRDLD